MTAAGTASQSTSVRGDSDFNRLWFARAVSDLGSAVGLVALPLVAVVVLRRASAQAAHPDYDRHRPGGHVALVLVGLGLAGLLGFATIANAALATYRQTNNA